MTGALHVLQVQMLPLSPSSLAPTKSRMDYGDILVPTNAAPPGKMAVEMDKEYSKKIYKQSEMYDDNKTLKNDMTVSKWHPHTMLNVTEIFKHFISQA